MSTPDAITRFPDPAFSLMQFSSFDRRSIHPDSAGWFADNDCTRFIREEENDGRYEYKSIETAGAIIDYSVISYYYLLP